MLDALPAPGASDKLVDNPVVQTTVQQADNTPTFQYKKIFALLKLHF